MLVWDANFNVPNSGTQVATVYAFAGEVVDGSCAVKFYGDEDQTIYLFEESFSVSEDSDDVYGDLLDLEYFSLYRHGNTPVVQQIPAPEVVEPSSEADDSDASGEEDTLP